MTENAVHIEYSNYNATANKAVAFFRLINSYN